MIPRKTLLDLTAGSGATSGYTGPRPFLSRAHMAGLRLLLAPYILGFVLMGAMNFRAVGSAVFRLSSQHVWFAISVGILISAVVLTFLLLLGLCLYHFLKGHAGEKPAPSWLWVILLLNVAGVVAYYLRVIEPEQRALLDAERGASGSSSRPSQVGP